MSQKTVPMSKVAEFLQLLGLKSESTASIDIGYMGLTVTDTAGNKTYYSIVED